MFCDYISDLLCGIPMWIYVVVLCTIIGGCILSRSKDKRKKLFAWLFLVVYVVLILCSTVIFRKTQTVSHYGFKPFWHYEAFRQGRLQLLPELIMNILAFIPIGFVFCLTFRRIRWWQAAMCGMGLSIGIELLQWVFKRGCTDIDDVIHNTFGCVIGCCLYVAVSRFFAKIKNNI